MGFCNRNDDIIEKLRCGDKVAFENVYWTYRKQVFGLAVRYLKDEQLAEDAVQDVFLKLWVYRKNLDSEKSLQGFLFRTLKNHVLNIIKSKKRRILRHYEYTRSTRSKDGELNESISIEEGEQIFNRGLQQLSERKKLIFKLKSFDGYSNKEIAEQLGITIDTVKSQFYRANKFIRKYIATHIDG